MYGVSSHCHADLALALPSRLLSPREKRVPSLSLPFLCEEKLFGDLGSHTARAHRTINTRAPLDRQGFLDLGRQSCSVSFANDDLIYLSRVGTVTIRVSNHSDQTLTRLLKATSEGI